jgi:hypothetical protein
MTIVYVSEFDIIFFIAQRHKHAIILKSVNITETEDKSVTFIEYIKFVPVFDFQFEWNSSLIVKKGILVLFRWFVNYT